MDNNYYVYAYLREDGTPYYIGKGTGNRIHGRHGVPVPPKERRVLLESNLSEQESFDLEISLISKYGRKDLGTGILRNLTNGGEGCSGAVRSEETRLRMSKPKSLETRAKMSKPKSEEHKAKLSIVKKGNTAGKGKIKSEETKAKISAANKGRKLGPLSEETKAKMSAARKGRVHSEETKAKLSAASKGKPKSEEHKAKLSAAHKAKSIKNGENNE